MKEVSFKHIAKEVREGDIAILPTDTIYGLVASVHHPKSIEKLYELMDRPTNKPCIVLISQPSDLVDFGVETEEIEKTKEFWPGPVSIVLKVGEGWEHVDRGTKTIAFRLPDNPKINDFVSESGPVIASSANPNGKEPATTLQEAKDYFPEIKLCCDGGELKGAASTVIDLTGSEPRVLRHGAHDYGQAKNS